MKLFSLKALSLPLLLLLFVSTVTAQNGPLGQATVHGVVRDDAGEPIPGVTVTASRVAEDGGGSVSVTEMDGTFRIGGLRPGRHRVEAVLDGFKPVSREVTLTTGQLLELGFKLVPSFAETVEVVAQSVPTGEVAILESRRQAAVVSDSISAEEIRKSPDSSAAGVVERLTGVTLIGDKYVFVRGLGERYSGTTINGATLPTTETEKRVVPLDLFPAKLLETVSVVKTYTPDRPGDFGSGVVEMTTTAFPSTATMKVTAGAGYQSSATGNDFRRYAGGLNRFGGGGQSTPVLIPREALKRSSVLDPSGFTPLQLEPMGEALIGDWTGARTGSASPATDFSLTYGNTFGRLGVVLSGVSNHRFETIDEEQRFFGLDTGGDLVPRNDYDMTVDRESANAGLVGNFSLRLADSHQVHLNTVFTRDATSEDRVQEGLNTNSGGFIRDFRVRYQIEEVLSTRLRGEHNLSGPGMGSLLDWNVSHSEASNESDLRENMYRESAPGVFALQTGSTESGKVDFFDLQDLIDQAGVSYSVFFTGSEATWSGLFKMGVDVLDRTRDFGARRFRFVTNDQLQFNLVQTPDEIFTPENIRPNGFEIREVTGINDAYDAQHTVESTYLMGDATFGKWRFIAGARYESSEQSVITFNPFDVANEVVSLHENRDMLPSLNVVYEYAPRSNLRFAYGRSLNRPEFRELSPFSFVEVSGGRSVAGNPELTQASIDGLDLRWETFPNSGEVIAASLFYKLIDDPIERIVQPTTELRTSFVNADSATLWGVELEFRRGLEKIAPLLRWWSVNLNYAYINSEVTVGEQQFSVVTNLNRPLEGQSDQVTNLAFQFLQPQWGTMFRVLGSYSGQRITDVGAFGLPDVYENPFTSLDFVISQALSNRVDLKLTGSNLLDEVREFTQADEIQRRYEPGRSIGLSVSYSPF